MYGHVADTLNPEVRRAWDDPFWANEGKAEIGFAFENQVSMHITPVVTISLVTSPTQTIIPQSQC